MWRNGDVTAGRARPGTAVLTALFAAAVTVASSAACSNRASSSVTSEAAESSTGPAAPATVPTGPALTAAGSPPEPSDAATAVPPVSPAARAAGLADVRTLVPDAIIDLRYATADNFTREALYPPNARCLVHSSIAAGLEAAAGRLRAQGFRLVFWDCYRPHAVQLRMFRVVSDPAWVARPGPFARSHEAGRSVDVSLAGPERSCAAAQRVDGHCLLDMGTGFDDFTPRARAFATSDVSATAQRNRFLLREAMNAGGLRVYSGEWWHFDGPGAGVDRPLLTAPVD